MKKFTLPGFKFQENVLRKQLEKLAKDLETVKEANKPKLLDDYAKLIIEFEKTQIKK